MTLNANWARESGESRTEEYRGWRTRLGCGAVCDVDQVEYCGKDGRPILTIELCVADRRSEQCPAGIPPGQPPSPRFFAAVEQKVADGRAQGRAMRHISTALEAPLLLVVYIKGELVTSGVWVKRMDVEGAQWSHLTLDEYSVRIRMMHARVSRT